MLSGGQYIDDIRVFYDDGKCGERPGHSLDAASGAAEGGPPMTPKRLSALLVLALAAIALTVCAGLAAGVSMWPWIVGYWAVLTAKNIVDWIGVRKNE